MNIDEIIARLHELEKENSMLKSLLFKHGIAYEKAKPEAVVLAPESKKQNSAMHRLTLQESLRWQYRGKVISLNMQADYIEILKVKKKYVFTIMWT